MASADQPNRDVTITRIFNAPRELVFKAFTDAKLVQQWWGPHYFTNPVCEIDPRPGGKILIHMQAPDGTVYPEKGVFQEVVEPERLVFIDSAFEDEAGNPLLEVHNTITFEEYEGKTKMTLQAVVLKRAPEVEEALSGMEEGWSQSFEKLADTLEKIEARK